MKDFIDIITIFLDKMGKQYNIAWLTEDLIIYILGFAILAFILKFFYSGVKYVLLQYAKSEFKNNVQFYTSEEVNQATNNYIKQSYQNSDPAKLDEPFENQFTGKRIKLIKKFTNDIFLDKRTNEKYYIILGDTGLGKTTFLINLYIKYKQKISIFGHFPRKFDIVLYPLNHGNLQDYISSIDSNTKQTTILLLDAFDEDSQTENRIEERLNEIIEITQDFKFVIITSRTQFFSREKSISNFTKIKKSGPKKGLHRLTKMYISPFSNSEVQLFLWRNNRFKFFKIWKSWRIVKRSPFLMARPLLLNHINQLLKIKGINFSQLQIYGEIIDMWLTRESSICGEKITNCKQELYDSMIDITLKIHENHRESNHGLAITSSQLEGIANKHSIDLKKLSYHSKSLLNRHVDDFLKFSHKSIYEYFLAIISFTDYDFYKLLNWKANLFSRDIFISLIKEEVANGIIFYQLDSNFHDRHKEMFVEECVELIKSGNEFQAFKYCVALHQLNTSFSNKAISEIQTTVLSKDVANPHHSNKTSQNRNEFLAESVASEKNKNLSPSQIESIREYEIYNQFVEKNLKIFGEMSEYDPISGNFYFN